MMAVFKVVHLRSNVRDASSADLTETSLAYSTYRPASDFSIRFPGQAS